MAKRKTKNKNNIISAYEVADLYNKYKNEWLLLEVIKRNEKTGKADRFILIDHDGDKNKLYDMMESDDWDWDKEYMFVFADPDSVCNLK